MIKKIKSIFIKKTKTKAPVMIIERESGKKEFTDIEEAMREIEKDPDIPKGKLEKLRISIEALKNKDTIKIKGSDIIK